MKSLQPAIFRQNISDTEDVVILDTRDATSFIEGFIPGSVLICLNEHFVDWATSLLDPGLPILLVGEPGNESDAIDRLSRAGFSDLRGYLQGGISEWINDGHDIDMVIQIEADELAMDLPFDDNLLVLDVRHETEFAAGHVKDALNLPLKTMNDPASMASLEETHNIYIVGGHDDKSIMAAALLKRQGFHNLRTTLGGWEAISKEKGIPTEKEKDMLN